MSVVKCIKAEVGFSTGISCYLCIVRWETLALWAPLHVLLAYWKQLHRVSRQNEADEHIVYNSVWYIVELLPIHHSVLAALISISFLKAKILCDSLVEILIQIYVKLFNVFIPLSVNIHVISAEIIICLTIVCYLKHAISLKPGNPQTLKQIWVWKGILVTISFPHDHYGWGTGG